MPSQLVRCHVQRAVPTVLRNLAHQGCMLRGFGPKRSARKEMSMSQILIKLTILQRKSLGHFLEPDVQHCVTGQHTRFWAQHALPFARCEQMGVLFVPVLHQWASVCGFENDNPSLDEARQQGHLLHLMRPESCKSVVRKDKTESAKLLKQGGLVG